MWTVPHPGLQLYGPDRVWTVRAYSFRCRPCREKWTGWKCGTFRISVVCRSGASCVYNFIASIGPIPDIHPSSKTLWPIDMKLCASYTVGELRVLWLVIVGPLEDMFLRLTGLTWFEALALASVWCSTAYWDCRLFLYRPTFASSLKAVIRLIQLPLRWQLAGDVACVWNCWHGVSRCPRAAESRVSWIGTWHAELNDDIGRSPLEHFQWYQYRPSTATSFPSWPVAAPRRNTPIDADGHWERQEPICDINSVHETDHLVVVFSAVLC